MFSLSFDANLSRKDKWVVFPYEFDLSAYRDGAKILSLELK